MGGGRGGGYQVSTGQYTGSTAPPSYSSHSTSLDPGSRTCPISCPCPSVPVPLSLDPPNSTPAPSISLSLSVLSQTMAGVERQSTAVLQVPCGMLNPPSPRLAPPSGTSAVSTHGLPRPSPGREVKPISMQIVDYFLCLCGLSYSSGRGGGWGVEWTSALMSGRTRPPIPPESNAILQSRSAPRIALANFTFYFQYGRCCCPYKVAYIPLYAV